MGRSANNKLKNPTSSKQGSIKPEVTSSENESGGLSWPMTIVVAFLAMFAAYHTTVKLFMKVLDVVDTSSSTTKDLRTMNEPLPCGASQYIAEVSVPGLHLVINFINQ